MDIFDALKNLLKATFPSIPVDLGYPVGGYQRDHIVIGGRFDIEAELGVSGLQVTDDAYHVEVRIVTTLTTSDFPDVLAEAISRRTALKEALRSNRTLSGTCMQAAVTRSRFEEALPDETSRQIGMTATVRIET